MLFQAPRRKSLIVITSGLVIGLACVPSASPVPTGDTSPADVVREQRPVSAETPASVSENPPASESTLAGCPVFPPDNEWNRRVSNDAVDPRSAEYLAAMNAGTRFLHADFGGDGQYGIPWTTVSGSQARVPMTFDYDDESDPGPYPIPADAPIEGGGGDRHILLVDRDSCLLYETFDTHYVGPGWHAGSGAIFDLNSNAQRPRGWTSADAAGLPILPGLVRLEEVKAGQIRHALRFTAQRTQRAFVAPARHHASPLTDPTLPPMGLRVRLKASYDTSAFGPTAQVVLAALKEYGMFLADNGADWFLSGETNPDWNDDELAELTQVPASAFEVVVHAPLER